MRDQIAKLAEAQKATWAARWPSERVSDTQLGADTRRMVQVGVSDDGELIGDVEGGLEPVAEGEKSVMDFLQVSLGTDAVALLAEFDRLSKIEAAARALRLAGRDMMDEFDPDAMELSTQAMVEALKLVSDDYLMRD